MYHEINMMMNARFHQAVEFRCLCQAGTHVYMSSWYQYLHQLYGALHITVGKSTLNLGCDNSTSPCGIKFSNERFMIYLWPSLTSIKNSWARSPSSSKNMDPVLLKIYGETAYRPIPDRSFCSEDENRAETVLVTFLATFEVDWPITPVK